MSTRFDGKTVCVTGGGSGLGRAISRRFLEEGARVAVLGRRRSALVETLDWPRGDRGQAIACDVTDDAEVRAASQRIQSEFGRIDVLVNNAGVGGPNSMTDDGEDRWREILAVNLDGVFFVTRAVLPAVPDGGRIVNISSVLGKFGVPGYTAYCTSKHGLIGFTRSLALELAPKKITVNAVCPGWTETVMAQDGMKLLAAATGKSFEEARLEALAAVPLQRMLEPAEIASLVAWIACDEAAGMTGQAINFSGGSAVW